MGGRFLWVIVIVTLIFIYYKYNENTFDPKTLQGKRVLVTGSSSGIGEEMSYQYCKLGAIVMITARRENILKEVADKCKHLGATKVEYIAADMSKPLDRERLVKETYSKLGGLDYLILNHALINMDFWDNSPENFTVLQNAMNINFISYVDVASRSMKMLNDSNGSIGVVSSSAGKLGGALANFYSPTKFALDGFFSSLRQELIMKGIDVSITIIILGYTATDSANEIKQRLLPRLEDPPVAQINDTASLIIKEVGNRRIIVYYPFLEWVLVTLGVFFPKQNDDFRMSMLPYYVAQ